MNRKIFLPLIIFASFFLFLCKANALVPLCIYKEYNNSSENAKTAYLYLGDSFVYANVSDDNNSFYYFIINSNLAGFQASSASGLISNLIFNSNVDSTQYANQMLNNPGSVTYRFGNSYRTGTKLNNDGTLSSRNIEVNWDGDLKQKFSNSATCPQYFVSDGAFIFDSPSLAFRNDASGFGTNNIVFELTSGAFNLSVSELSSELNSCLTDSSRINYYKSLFNSDTFSGNAAEQAKMMKYVQNNYGAVLLPIIQSKYVEGGECYNANPDKQAEYGELSTVANTFASRRSGGLGAQDINSCDDVINGKFAQHLNSILRFIMYLGPILTIVLSSADYFKAMISNDNDAMKKINRKTIVRVIAALLLFFIPLIIRILLSIFGFDSSCSIIN